MTPRRFQSQVAILAVFALVVTILAPAAHARAAADDLGSFGGKVFQPDGRTPRPGVVVRLVDANGTPVSSSAPTTAEGSFLIADATPGSYHLLIETADGAFLAPDRVRVVSGTNRPVSLTLQQPAGTAPATDGTAAAGSPALAAWATWLIAGGIIVGALVLINEINDEDDASPFN